MGVVQVVRENPSPIVFAMLRFMYRLVSLFSLGGALPAEGLGR